MTDSQHISADDIPKDRKKDIYAWDPFGNEHGLPIGGQVEGEHISTSIFMKGKDLESSFIEWSGKKGIKRALETGTHNMGIGTVDQIVRTANWIKKKSPLQYVTAKEKEEIIHLDVINLEAGIPCVSERVTRVFNEVCPNDFESFPITLHTSTGAIDDYYLINLTQLIKDALNLEYSVVDFNKEKSKSDPNSATQVFRLILQENCMDGHGIGRLFEDNTIIMVSEEIIEKFNKYKLQGINCINLEDNINCPFKRNYRSDGNLV